MNPKQIYRAERRGEERVIKAVVHGMMGFDSEWQMERFEQELRLLVRNERKKTIRKKA